jgi:hypothetical protein
MNIGSSSVVFGFKSLLNILCRKAKWLFKGQGRKQCVCNSDKILAFFSPEKYTSDPGYKLELQYIYEKTVLKAITNFKPVSLKMTMQIERVVTMFHILT